MIVLGIETATPAGGAAIWRDGRIAACCEQGGEATHSERLLPAIERVLRDAGLALSDLDGIAVSIGPGSFMGLRIGLACAKALALAAEKPIVPVSTLEALAWRFARPGILAAPMLDARRSEIFAALFRRDEPGGALARLTPDVAERPEVFAKRIESPCLAGGLGATRYGDLFAQLLGNRFALAEAEVSSASAQAIAELGAQRLAAGETAELLSIEPAYVRKSDAEVRKQGVGFRG